MKPIASHRLVVLPVVLVAFVAASCGGSGYSQEELDAAVDRAVDRALDAQTTTPALDSSSTTTQATTTTTQATTTTTEVTTTSTSRPTSTTSTTSLPPTTTVARYNIGSYVNVAWWVSPPDSGESETVCGDMASSYQVEVRDGGNVIQAVARLEGPELVRNELTSDWQAIECNFRYSAVVAEMPVYVFTLSGSGSDGVLASVAVNHEELAAKGGPNFFVSFACVAYPCETRALGGYRQDNG